MAHEFWEVSLEALFAMSDTDFLLLCEHYLARALEDDRLAEIERQASAYGRFAGIEAAGETPWFGRW